MYDSLEKIIEEEMRTAVPFWKLIQKEECSERAIPEEESLKEMQELYQFMCASFDQYDPMLSSASGLIGGDGERFQRWREEGNSICGPLVGKAMETALKISESNACMKRIVAAPTAGSCGVIPAVFLGIQEQKGFPDKIMTEALYVAAGIGGVIASRAFLSGAAGGCQAEIGSASAMAAGGLAYLLGGNAEKISHAAALSLKNTLGLACDPVAGLVEVPCVKRNVLGAVNAIASADLAMAGITSKIPPDEVIDAMRSIGRGMSDDIRETGKGGLAGTQTGILYREKVSTEW